MVLGRFFLNFDLTYPPIIKGCEHGGDIGFSLKVVVSNLWSICVLFRFYDNSSGWLSLGLELAPRWRAFHGLSSVRILSKLWGHYNIDG